jgi:hypothetical protein
MITAQEFLDKIPQGNFDADYLIEFTKRHVDAALKAASEKAELDYGNGSCRECGSDKIDKQSILTAYPLDLIK